jgi:hypothetical protein
MKQTTGKDLSKSAANLLHSSTVSTQATVSEHPLLTLQRSIGNRAVGNLVQGQARLPDNTASRQNPFDYHFTHAHDVSDVKPNSERAIVQRKCACDGGGASGECEECSNTSLHLQTKLSISRPGDRYEQEADRIADQVLATPSHFEADGAPVVQRFSQQASGNAGAPPASVGQALASPGNPLDRRVRHDMEKRFGYDFSDVRVHSGPTAEQSAREVSAHAYTVGHNIVFDAGRFEPGTNEGRRLLAHELAHVVQQSGGVRLQRQPSGPSRVGRILSLKEIDADPKRKRARNRTGQTTAKVCKSISAGAGKANCPATLDPGLQVTIVSEKAGGAWLQIVTPEQVPGFGPKEPVYVMAAFVEEVKPKSATPKSDGPTIKDITRLDQTVPIKGLAKDQPNYIDHFSGRLESAPLGSDITLFPKTGSASQSGISIPKGDFYIDSDPLSGFSMGHNQVYKSRSIAEAVVTDMMKQAPDTPVYTYYIQDGIIFPSTLSNTTIPNLLPYIRQKREQDMADVKATADLAEAVMWWYVGARFPIKIKAGGGGTAGKEALKQLEKEATKQAEKELAKKAATLAEQMAAKHGNVVVNLGGTGEVANAINLNPLTAQQVKAVPNLVRAGAEEVGSIFKPGTIDKIVSNNVVQGTVNWTRTAEGSFSALKSGGQVSIAPYAGGLAEHLQEIQTALRAAGFKEVKVVAGHVVTAVKP